MEIQRYGTQPAIPTPPALTARASQEPPRRTPPDRGATTPRRQEGIDYQAYNRNLVERPFAADTGNTFDPGYSPQAQRALSAYAAQQQSLERENIDNVRNLLGVDYYV